MKTRSSMKICQDFNSRILPHDESVLAPLYSVEIDFDGASEAWKANKKSIGNSSYKYICEAKTISGNECKRESLKGCHYCKTHEKQKEKKEQEQKQKQKQREKKEKKVRFQCPGCFPIFQENQLGHIGPHGCIGNYEF